MFDTIRHKGKRKILVNTLREKYNISEIVLSAIEALPRHLFVDKEMEESSYLDRPLPIAAKQTISQPSTVAMQSHLLGLPRGSKVLEIGTGSGYQTALLALMGYKIYSIERQKSLYIKAKQNLDKISLFTPILFHGDGFAGLPKFAPFDGILVTCGAPDIPKELLKQLAVGGKMVIPVGVDTQKMVVVKRISQEEYTKEEYGDFKFVPMLSGIVSI